ncbi:uncharacterized protein [Typha latifolia]|uniref:uncharacterized protein isoform X1 n=2 Tax=Typha latifolia TaxID=4733 RepID=UPI003C2C86F2
MSARSHVTITLGRSGQQVVKRGSLSDVSHSDCPSSLGGKRPIKERLGGNMEDSHLHGNQYKNKRRRVESHSSSFNDDLDDEHPLSNHRVGQEDLRLKLMRKDLAERRNIGTTKRNEVDLREKLSRNSQNSSRYDTRQEMSTSRASGLPKRIPPARSAEDLLQLDLVKRSYSSWTLDEPRRRSPDRFLSASRALSPPKSYSELRNLSSVRSLDASMPSSYMTKDALDGSRPSPYLSKSTGRVDATKSVVRAPSSMNAMQRNPFASEEPLTVASLLHSLGLGKYAILFQAEEVDMTALKQMGDNDLKELGIPMGPRKKILLAVLSPSKHRYR